jgi:hypothetical protein
VAEHLLAVVVPAAGQEDVEPIPLIAVTSANGGGPAGSSAACGAGGGAGGVFGVQATTRAIAVATAVRQASRRLW